MRARQAIAFVRPDETMGEGVLRFLETQKELAERKSDELIDLVLRKINFPWWIPKRIVRRILDQLLPGKIFDLIELLLQKTGQLPSDRELHPLNPFRD